MNPTFLKRFGVLFATALLAAAGCSSSDSKTTGGGVTGTFVGAVKSSTGSALAGVTVTPNPANGPAVVTDSSGKYSMPVAAGSYTLTFAGDNLQTATASASVAMGETVTVPDQTMQPSPLTVKVNLPAALINGGPSGFNTTVTGITASVKMNGSDVSADGVTWSIKDYYGLTDPPDKAAAPSSTSGSSTGFAIGDLETVREGANAWLNARYGTTGTEEEFEYIQAPERDQLLSFGVQQVRAMSFKVIARVTSGGLTSTGSAIVSPVTISNGGNTLPLGMMVVGNTAKADAYNWTLTYLATDAVAGTAFGAPPAEVTLQGATTKNPTVVPTVGGVYQLTNAAETAATPISFRISTYHGAGMSELDPGPDGLTCQTSTCHTSGSDFDLKPKFDAWRASAHGNFNFADPMATPIGLFKFGLSGGEGSHYSESCIGCHTVGYSKVPTANNKGFDDMMAAESWTFPTPPDTFDPTFANWNAMPASLKYRGGIQCEACHGPLNTTDHPSVAAIGYSLVPPSASMKAGVCLVCHDALSNHDKGPLWASSGHANTDLAIEEGAGSKSCARCHSAEGFMLYLPLQQAGTPGNLPDITSLSAATVNPQTCQTCHDPHSTKLRVDGDTKLTAAGFSFQGAGAGALCMICHNTRNGAKFNNGPMFTWGGPHTPSQGDIFAGRNAFFFGKALPAGFPTDPASATYATDLAAATAAAAADLPNKTAHSFMAETCADCHVEWVPADLKAQFTPAGTNHTFRTTREVCANCHAENIGDLVAEQVDGKMAELSSAIAVLFLDRLNVGDLDAVKYQQVADGAISETATASTVTIAAGTVQRVALSTFHGSPALIFTLTDGTQYAGGVTSFLKGGKSVFGAYTMPPTAPKATDVALVPAQTIVAKAFYNYMLINGGSAHGLHNPAYVNGVLDATLAALDGVTLP